jgi:hypothetical protein
MALAVERLDAAEVLEVEASEGIGFTTERLAMLGLEGGAAMFLGSNLDFFSAAPAAVVEGRFLLSREAMFRGELDGNSYKSLWRCCRCGISRASESKSHKRCN